MWNLEMTPIGGAVPEERNDDERIPDVDSRELITKLPIAAGKLLLVSKCHIIQSSRICGREPA
jgi:hypothetical protein